LNEGKFVSSALKSGRGQIGPRRGGERETRRRKAEHAEQDGMQRASRNQSRLDREETGKAVALGSASGIGVIEMAVMVVLGAVRMVVRMCGRRRMQRMQVAAERHDREMKNAHRPEQNDEAKAQEFAGREPMHETRYKIAVPNCHHPVCELREVQFSQIN
jgi:hypothetical protein